MTTSHWWQWRSRVFEASLSRNDVCWKRHTARGCFVGIPKHKTIPGFVRPRKIQVVCVRLLPLLQEQGPRVFNISSIQSTGSELRRTCCSWRFVRSLQRSGEPTSSSSDHPLIKGQKPTKDFSVRMQSDSLGSVVFVVLCTMYLHPLQVGGENLDAVRFRQMAGWMS